MARFVFFISFLFTCSVHYGQIISGPMLGPVELRDAGIWLEVSPSVKEIKLLYNKRGQRDYKTISYKLNQAKEFNPVQFFIGGLDINTTYEYRFLVDNKPVPQKGVFTTKDLWQHRKPVPDFSFLTGSCAYFNEPVFDRPGKPYGGDSSIFETMAKEKAAFMLWLGDNWYTREVDFYSKWGLWYRAQHDRKTAVLQNFLKAMPHIAMWDDHDFGPDNSGSSFILKETSRDVFKNYWMNPSFGENEQGVYTKYSHGDVDIFMCDDRWWRSSDAWKDSVNGRPNAEKIILGPQQLAWLKNSLLYSKATFKIIMIGTQVLNQLSRVDGFSNFPLEYNDLMAFLNEYNISGVLFLTGDRHLSEIMKMERPGNYTLYDITVSPLTSGISRNQAYEINNPNRVINAIETYNYARLSFTGPTGSRKLNVEFVGTKGEKLGDWSIEEKALKN